MHICEGPRSLRSGGLRVFSSVSRGHSLEPSTVVVKTFLLVLSKV